MESLKLPFPSPGPALRRCFRIIAAWRVRHLLWLASVIRHTALQAVEHDCLNVAQSAAYSAMVALFPALIVAAAVSPMVPYTAPLRGQLAHFFDRILPSDVIPLLQTYFASDPTPQSHRAVTLAAIVSLTGASSVIASLMEGFRRAYDLQPNAWGFWRRRLRAYLLVPLSLVPLGIASFLVVFGHLFTQWFANHLALSVRAPVYLIALVIRWAIALLGSVGVIGVIYHLGTPIRQGWHRTLPGAVAATVLWFVTTLVFGWYVTRFANYAQVYGSLGAGIALLFWLYIISFSVLCGAEFNAQFFRRKTTNPGSG